MRRFHSYLHHHEMAPGVGPKLPLKRRAEMSVISPPTGIAGPRKLAGCLRIGAKCCKWDRSAPPAPARRREQYLRRSVITKEIQKEPDRLLPSMQRLLGLSWARQICLSENGLLLARFEERLFFEIFWLVRFAPVSYPCLIETRRRKSRQSFPPRQRASRSAGSSAFAAIMDLMAASAIACSVGIRTAGAARQPKFPASVKFPSRGLYVLDGVCLITSLGRDFLLLFPGLFPFLFPATHLFPSFFFRAASSSFLGFLDFFFSTFLFGIFYEML